MNLVIDIGNTRIKAGLFQQKELLLQKNYSGIQELAADSQVCLPARKAIICSVIDSDLSEFKFLNHYKPLIHFSYKTPIPIKNLYTSPSTLGSDRIAAAVGANALFPSANLLAIDTGTCLKYNFVNKKNEFVGGAISPGLQMRFNALHHYTEKLPLLACDENFNHLIGTTTHDSILSGVINGIIQETDGIIEEYKKCYPDLTILVSGGDTAFFAKRLKNRIFAHPHLVMQGLNEILILNS